MSKVSVSKIVRDVEICMDEIAQNDAEFDDFQDDGERGVIIVSKIRDALRFVYANADWSLLDPDEVITDTDNVTYTDNNVVLYTLPDNYLRLCYAKLNSWARYLGQEDLIYWRDQEYSKLQNKYATGTPDRPKVAMGWSESAPTKRQLELYSAKAYTDDSKDGVRIALMYEPTDDENGDYNIGDKVYRGVIYYITGLVYTTYYEAQKAQLMFDEANDIIGFTQRAQAVAARQQAIQAAQAQ